MNTTLDNLSPILTEYIQEQYFSAVAVGVYQAGEAKIKTWGTTTWGGPPLTPSHLYDLASLTKLYTTMAVLKLMHEQRFQEHTKIIDLLPFENLQLKQQLGHLTVSELLTHHSGLPAWYPFYTRRGEDFQTILQDLLKEHPITDTMIYSDINFILLGLIVSNTTNLCLHEAIQTLVLNPLGLKETTYHPDSSLCVATEYGNQIEKQMVHDRGLSFNGWRDETTPIKGSCNDGNAHYFFQGVSGHAGLFSSPQDVLTFGKAFLSADHAKLDARLYSNTIKDWGEGRGYGIQFGELYPDQGFGHTGFTGTYLYVNPKRDLVITILTNRLHTQTVRNINSIRLEIVGRLLGP
ncbi:class A beta-lactamase-related serine hydrolase [Sphaerochaeta halotolerans]|uniref:Class A beta-lactamase-related serine hydrolase n=1 Tax=Sphaerochaeta halotolerans TaxID=2293840 RepID=A0A372MDD0_9SPIR|nr:serine hydrolase domain-containing protein [Sphaerochaeta halotolerans]RFU93811.1 class A beta-lactamase-related serine hydrolase [Sphaerochaeta halotolerans]